MMGKMEIRTPPGSRPRDGRHCDLCGCSQPAVRCDKCGCQIFCLSCDDMYHRHPKRRFHLRKAVDSIPQIPQARPVLPMKASQLNAINPGDPSKMPLPPPRKKKSLFSSFRKPSSENSPPLPKKEYSWTDRLGSIKKFMSNRPLPPLPSPDDHESDSHPATNGQVQRGDLSFIHKRTEERPPQLPQRSPRSPNFPGINQEKENRIPCGPFQPPGQVRNGSFEPNANHMNQNHEFNSNDPNHWNNHVNHQNDAQSFGTLNRQRPFMPPGMPGYPGGMHQSSSATDLHNLHNTERLHGPVPQHYPHYPVNPHMPPHYPYPMYPGYPNYPQYFGNSFANLSNPPTSEDFSDSESASRHSSKRQSFRKRAKRSQSVMVDRMAFPGQYFPFGPYPGYGPWGAPMPMETPPSPASSVRSLNRMGRSRRRKKGTSEEDDEELSETSSPMSRPKSSSSDPKEHPRAPLATQTTSSEDESDANADKRRNKINTIRRQSEPLRSPSPVISNTKASKLKKSSSKQSDSDTQENPLVINDKRPSGSITEQRQSVRQSPIQQQSDVQRLPTPQQPTLRESPIPQSVPVQPHASNSTTSVSPETWECRHCTFINPIANKICQVCCKTATPRTETPTSIQSRPSSSSAKNRKGSVGSENEYFVPDEKIENEPNKKDKQDMASLNSALDEAEKQISKGLEELMKLKDDIDSNVSVEKSKSSEIQTKTDGENKPVYKSSGKMRSSILDKLNLNKSQATNSSVSTSTETQTDQNNRTVDKIIEARRRLSNSSSASETYNSPLAQSPELERGYLGSREKRDSSCQTQQDSLAEYLEKRKAAEEVFLGRPINNFGFGYGDRMDMVTSPVPAMYDRFYGGGYGMMQRSHSRASLFTGRVNDFGPMEYGPGFGYGPTPMYRSVSRGSLTGDYPDGRMSEFHNLRKPDYYLSMEELVERRRQDNIRAQGLELVRMIREAEQQGFNADDIQVALTHCGKQNPLEWLQENWRNMVDSVVTLSTNYGNDKKENDIGMLSENESRDALRLHKGNIWAAVTECVEGRQRKYLELSARGNFSRQDIVDALASSEGDVEMAYAKLTKSTGTPFLMRIWGQGEGAQNQDGAKPMSENVSHERSRYLKDETLNSDGLSDDIWSEDEDAVEWDDEEEYDDEERGDIEDLRTCHEDLPGNPQEMMTPESEKSEYCDAFSVDDRNVSSPSDEIFFVIPEAKPEKKKGFLSKLVALRRDSKEHSETSGKEVISPQNGPELKEDSEKTITSSEQKNSGPLNTLKNKFSAIKDSVTGASKNDKKVASAQLDRRTIIVSGQLEHELLNTNVKEVTKSSSDQISFEEESLKTSESNLENNEKLKCIEDSQSESTKSAKIDIDKISVTNLSENIKIKSAKIVETESKQTNSKKAENKSSQSLAERLKFAKQNRSSFNEPGPSGINKQSFVQPSAAKEITTVQSEKENHVNVNSELVPETETSAVKTNVKKIPNSPNLEKYESKDKDTFKNQSSQLIANNVNHEGKTENNLQHIEALEDKKMPHEARRDLSEKSNLTTKTEPIKTDASINKTPNSNNHQTKKEVIHKTNVEPLVTNEKTSAETESQINSKNDVLLKEVTSKVVENNPSSVLESKKDKNKNIRILEIDKQDNASKSDSSNIIKDFSENNVSSESKVSDGQKVKSETAVRFAKEFSPEVSVSENKTSIIKGKVEKDNTHLGSKVSKPSSERTKALKKDSKTVQRKETKINNSKTSAQITDLPKVHEISTNLESIENQRPAEKSQNSLIIENKTVETIVAKEESLVTRDNENASNSNEIFPKDCLIVSEILKPTPEENIKSYEIRKNTMSGEILKLVHDIPSDYNKQKDDVLTKDKQEPIVSNDSKNVKKAIITEIPEQEVQKNLGDSKILPENKLITQTNETSPDVSATCSSTFQENLSPETIINNTNDHSEIGTNTSKLKPLPSETSSENLISNQTNITEDLGIIGKENVLTSNKKTENLSQTVIPDTEAAQTKYVEVSNAQNTPKSSDKMSDVAETEKEIADNDSGVPLENNKDLTIRKVDISEPPEKDKEGSEIESKDKTVTNLVSFDNSQSTSMPNNEIRIVDENNISNNNIETLNKIIHEQSNKELPENKKVLSEKELSDVVNSSNKEDEHKLKEFENTQILSLEESVSLTENNTLKNIQSNSSEAIQIAPTSTGQNFATEKPKEINKISNSPENTEGSEKDLAPISLKNKNINSTETTTKKSSNATELQAPVFAKEFPNKSADVPESSAALSKTDEAKTILPNNEELLNSEPLPASSSINEFDNLNLSESASTTNTPESDKIVKTSLNTNNIDNTISAAKIVPNSYKIVEKQEIMPSSSTTTISENVAKDSSTQEKFLNNKTAPNSNTKQNASVSKNNTIFVDSSDNVSNESTKEKSSNIAISEIATTSSNTNIPDSSKSMTLLPNVAATDNIESKVSSISELSKSSTDSKSMGKDSESLASKPNEQHSKIPETVSAISSASTSSTNSSPAHTASSIQNKKFQRSVSEESKESTASESDDTDIEYSDNSRRGSLILPSPVDTLRSRFEGFASGTLVKGEPIRPASPFRRMSFNSRKQVIALERKRDTSSEKPWFHKIDPEPIKIVRPKKSVKQQLEMERKVRKMVADRKCRTYKKAEIVVQLTDMNFEEEEAIQAANECCTLEQAISYLQQECLLCTGHFPVSQIVSMTHCEHRACRVCIRAYFTVQIRDRTILDLLCPFCNEPDIGDEDVAQDYFNHLDIMLKKLVDIEIHELFQRKLRDRVLMKDPNFRWCSQCSSGFIAMPNLKRLVCPDCNAVTCASCRRLWGKEHQGITCEAFAALKDATDTEAQAAGLAKMLTEDGISCPSCHFRYALSKGGCMHFRCIQCQHDFCSGCSRPFKMGQKCGVSEFCTKLGLHAHHPRNCLFYLRDKEPEDLQKLLDISNVEYNCDPPDGLELKTSCQVMEQKETSDGMVDDFCGKEIQEGYAGLCRIHYVEYLGQLVNKYKVDPIQIFDNDDLELVLRRANIRLPPKRYRENDVQYREKLIKVIQEELPLDKMDGS